MTQLVVVRKYENRRLYDTSSSRYVNLPEIAQMVREGTEVQVVDAKSGDDITRVILTQIIHEDARQKKGDLPLPFLRELIVTSDRAFRDFLSWYADDALPFLERTLETLKQKAAPGIPGKPEAPLKADDVESLKARIADLEAQVAGRRAPRRKAPKMEAPPRRPARRGPR